MAIKVLELCEAYGGGVKRQVDYINNYMDRSQFVLTFLVSSQRTKTAVPNGYFVDDQLSNLKIGMHFIRVVRKIHRLVKKNNVEVIHAHSTVAGMWAILYKIIYCSSIGIVYTPHAYYSEVNRGRFQNLTIQFIERLMNYFFFNVLHVSEDEESYAFNHKLVTHKKSKVINNGVPIPKSTQSSSRTTCVNVARCNFQKNPELFIQIAAGIVKKMPDMQFVWVGDGPLLEDCLAEVSKRKLEKNIHFVGFSSHPYDYLINSEFFFSTSRYEGQPFSVLEALSVGKPLLITNVVGHTELVEHNGFLFNENESIDNITNKVKNIGRNLNGYSRASYSMFLNKYNVNVMVTEIANVYKSAC